MSRVWRSYRKVYSSLEIPFCWWFWRDQKQNLTKMHNSLSHCIASKPHPLYKNWRTNITGNINNSNHWSCRNWNKNMYISRHKVRLEYIENKKEHRSVLDILCHAFHQISRAHPGKTSLRTNGQTSPAGALQGDVQRQKGTSWMGWNKPGKSWLKNRSKPHNWMCFLQKIFVISLEF